MKIDKRIKYHVVLDVETAGGFDNPLVYDIGYAITDKQGRIYEERSFVISEIWEQKNLMNSAYYSKKIPRYEKDIKNGTRQVVKFLEMRKDLLELMQKYNVKVIGAYNLNFDTNALKNTMRNITQNPKAKFLTSEFKDLEMLCIWCLACETLYTQKQFGKMAIANNWLTDANNYKTSAEIGHRFITGELDFEEEHTGLEDVKIEIGIMAYAFRQNKKRTKGVFAHPWRIPNQKRYK